MRSKKGGASSSSISRTLATLPRAVWAIQRRLQAATGALTVVCADSSIRRLFEISGLVEVLNVQHSRRTRPARGGAGPRLDCRYLPLSASPHCLFLDPRDGGGTRTRRAVQRPHRSRSETTPFTECDSPRALGTERGACPQRSAPYRC